MKLDDRFLLVPLLAFFYWLILLAPDGRREKALLGHLAPGEPVSCSPWQQVNEGAFGLPSVFDEAGQALPSHSRGEPYRGEEGFETLVFKGSLYLGMEADNRLGARLWRTREGITGPQSQADWEEVIADTDGRPWGIEAVRQADHIDSLAEFNGQIFASTANGGTPSGTRIFRSFSGDPGTWEDALGNLGPGFGNPANENFKDMRIFSGWLCGGTWNEDSGAEVWCTQDGENWEHKNMGGWGDPSTTRIWSSAVFDGALYISAQVLGPDPGTVIDDTGVLYRTFSLDGAPHWEQAYLGDYLSIQANILGVLDGRLFIATSSRRGIEILSSSSGNPGSWQPANIPGMARSILNFKTVTDGAASYAGRLHVAIINELEGMRVWRSSGDGFWEIVGEADEYAPERFAAQLAVFNGSLYAWASDYVNGQAVLKTTCTDQSLQPAKHGIAGIFLLVLSLGLLLAWSMNRFNGPAI